MFQGKYNPIVRLISTRNFNQQTSLDPAINLAKANGNLMFAISVGVDIDQNQLFNIASGTKGKINGTIPTLFQVGAMNGTVDQSWTGLPVSARLDLHQKH